MNNKALAAKKALQQKAHRLRQEADALDREAAAIVVPLPAPPRKTRAQLLTEIEIERERNKSLVEALRAEKDAARAREPRDFSYFGLGDGPT